MLASLARPRARSVMGIDCSTHSIAFAIFHDKVPVRAGEVVFEGKNLFDRLGDAANKIPLLVKEDIMVADSIAFEAAVTVNNNHQTAASLAYVYGACISALMQGGMTVEKVNPLTWQSFIGNPNLKKAEKDKIRKDNPNRSENWYKNAGREFRKQRTLEIAKNYFSIPTDSDNVGDAVGVALWGMAHLPERVVH